MAFPIPEKFWPPLTEVTQSFQESVPSEPCHCMKSCPDRFRTVGVICEKPSSRDHNKAALSSLLHTNEESYRERERERETAARQTVYQTTQTRYNAFHCQVGKMSTPCILSTFRRMHSFCLDRLACSFLMSTVAGWLGRSVPQLKFFQTSGIVRNVSR